MDVSWWNSIKENKGLKSLGQFFLCKKIIIIDIFIITASVGLAVFLITDRYRILSEKPGEIYHPITGGVKSYPKNIAEDPILNTEDWENFRSQWYGFEMKYPKDWEKPKQKNSTDEDNWEYQYQFRKKEITEDDLFLGMDVTIYNLQEIKELLNTNEFPTIKNEELRFDEEC